jgi:hypothetical protein
LGGWIERRKKLKYRERRGNQFGWLPLDGETQQPTKSRPQQLAIVRGDGAQGNDQGGESCEAFWPLIYQGQKKNKSKFVVI